MIGAKMQPFLPARDPLMAIPGIARLSAVAVISEIGPDPRRYFPGAGHLASRAGLRPGNHESAGRHYSGRRRHGNVHLQSVMIEIAWAAVRHDGYLKSLYHRHVVRNGGHRSKEVRNKAIFTVAHAVIVIIWNMLSAGAPYEDLGIGYYDRPVDPECEARRLIARLEALGKHLTLEEAA